MWRAHPTSTNLPAVCTSEREMSLPWPTCVSTCVRHGPNGFWKRLNVEVCGSRTCKPNSVRRIAPAGRSFLWAAHYCAAQATYPEVVARRAGTCLGRQARGSLPIWSCSVWGLPCPPHYCGGGALLPHLFTLTSALPPGRYVFCGTFRRMVPPKQACTGHPPGRYPAHCSAEFGLSSPAT